MSATDSRGNHGHSGTHSAPSEPNADQTYDTARVTRPRLERDQPIRSWATLFGSPPVSPRASSPAASPEGGGWPAQGLTEAIDQGYSVINEYLRQSQQVAATFRPPMPSQGPPFVKPDDVQQVLKRVVLYGWDFMGVLVEMWTAMGNTPSPDGWRSWLDGWDPRSSSSPFPGSPPPDGRWAGPHVSPAPTPSPSNSSGTDPAYSQLRVAVRVRAESPAEAILELRQGPVSTLVLHALRAEGHDGPPILGASIQMDADGGVSINVSVPPAQPPGMYNGMLIDTATNLPRGTLTIVVGTRGP